jgi:DNA-binding MarR family transcriptional regulator
LITTVISGSQGSASTGSYKVRSGGGLDDYDILHQLSRSGAHGMRMTELAAATLIARSSCSRLVGELVGSGLVERHADPGDRRAVRVRLSAAGRGTTRRAGAVHVRGISRYIEGRLVGRDVDELARLLERLSRRP